MGTNVKSIKCPSCGAEVSFEDGSSKRFCSYCGSPIKIQNDNEQIIHNIDDAAIKRAETEQLIKLKQLEMEEKEREEKRRVRSLKIKALIGCLGIAAVIFLIGEALSNESLKICATVALYPAMFIGFSLLTSDSNNKSNEDEDDDDEDEDEDED